MTKSKKMGKIIITVAIIIAAIAILVNSLPAKTLSNKDIKYLKKKQNKGIPTYKGKNPAGIPTVPSGTGVPAVPGPEGKRRPGNTAAVVKKHLPYDEWEDEYRKYFKEYYRDSNLNLKPKMIVLHYSRTDNFTKLWWTFIKGSYYEGKKGHLSVHYVVDKDGSIYELMPPNRRARGTYGVNHVAISIDLIGKNASEILKNKKQMRVSFSLVKWLMKKYKVPYRKVLGHYEIARGKEVVPEYTDYHDKKYPDRYPPWTKGRGPGKAYMAKLRYFLKER